MEENGKEHPIEFSVEKSQEIADLIIPLISIIDFIVETIDIEYARAAAARMRGNASRVESCAVLLGPGCLDEVDDAHERADLFDAFISIFELRLKQRNNTIKRTQNAIDRDNIAHKLGLL